MSLLGGMSSWIDDHFEIRIRVLGIVMTGFFALFVVRLFQLQVVEGQEHLERSQRNSIRTERIASPRGELVDREGRLLASTRAAFELEVVPSELRDKDRTLAVLGALLGDDGERARHAVLAASGRARFQPVRLEDDLSFEQLARIESHRHALPGVLTEVHPLREYPYGSLAAHVIGTIGEIRASQLDERRFAGYRQGESIGQSGVESMLEPHLRGRAGGRNVVVDVAGRAVEVLDQVEPRAGGRAVLTLDVDLQQAAEDGLRAAAAPGDPAAGVVVALDPRNGDVLALASLPSFDPNAFPGGIESATWKALTTDPLKPLQDRAVAGQFPPGSTYKPLVAAIALQEKVRIPSAGTFCPGSFAYGNHVFRCWKTDRPRRRRHSPRDRAIVRRLLLPRGSRHRRRSHGGIHGGVRARLDDRHRARQRAPRDQPEQRVEAEALRQAVVLRRNRLDLDRTGLRRVDAAPARRRVRRARHGPGRAAATGKRSA
jgi:penicillin-binding protein 2